ncbi:MAG: site-specific DNA-methyltransferase [Actinomycetota bacterium]
MDVRSDRTQTSAFGVSRREGHDSSAFYARFVPPTLSDDETVVRPAELIDELGAGTVFHGSIDRLQVLPENSVALVVTSPPYFVGKEYELAVTGAEDPDDLIPGTYLEYLDMLRDVFAECARVLEPGGRIAINVANLGRKPYRSLSADVIAILQDDLGLLLRGEVIWKKASTSSGSCAWGSFARASNPVLRDVTERVVIASKGRFARARTAKARAAEGLPHESTLSNDEFVDVTRDVWEIDAESARRVGHPAPFPVELPRRLIDLYTYRDDIVVDPFAGSGSTLVAAARTGRIGVGFDIDPDYVALATERLDAELAADEDRQESYLAQAIDEGRKVDDVARRLLTDAGFDTIADRAKHPSGVAEMTFAVDHPATGERWWVDVAGSFTSIKPGLQRSDSVWRLLGQLHVMAATQPEGEPLRVLVLTPSLPKPGTPGDKALRAVGPGVIFDAIELYDTAGLDRLRAYASGEIAEPMAGFWTDRDLAARTAG